MIGGWFIWDKISKLSRRKPLRWRLPTIKHDRGFRHFLYKKGHYRYRVRLYNVPRSVNGGIFKVMLLKGYRRK